VWVSTRVTAGGTGFHVRTWDPAGDDGHRDGPDDRPLVLLLHGWPEDGTAWTAVAPLLAVGGLRVVAPDLKGFGASDSPRRGYDPATLADEISQLIRVLGARRATLVGQDWGGAVAVATAVRHPGRVDALVAIATPLRELDLRAAWHIPLVNLPILPELAFLALGGTLTRAALRHASADGTVPPEERVERYADAVSRHPAGWLAYYRVLSRRVIVDAALASVRRRLPVAAGPSPSAPLRVPATVLWGALDPVTPVRLADGVARDLGADLVVVEGAGHFVHEEAPTATAQAVLATMARVVPPLVRAA
jgi:epoxide hydrolase 4